MTLHQNFKKAGNPRRGKKKESSSQAGKKTIREALSQGVEKGVFPGAVLLVSVRGKIVFHEAAGFASLKPRRVGMTQGTLFDLASLTKPVVTVPAVMRLLEKKVLRLDHRVSRWIPEFRGGKKDSVTIGNLLNHSSGLRAWEPFYKEVIPRVRKDPKYIFRGSGRDDILSRVIQNRLVYVPGSKSIYSDLGFILLGEIVERASGKKLNRFFREAVSGPLKMKKTFFIPAGKKKAGRFAACEKSVWRKTIISGQVHDDNAFCMGGIAGHAGLFGTAADVNRFAGAMLKGWKGGKTLFSKNTIRRFTRRQRTPNSSWALGWDTPSEKSSSGRYLSASSFGHLGYTGTSLWIDPKRELTVVLLTNRVHPTSRNTKIRDFRPTLHDLIKRELL